MAYGLVMCGIGHIQSIEYHARVMEFNLNAIDSNRYRCNSQYCNSIRMYLITNYDPSLIIEKIVVGTFGFVGYADLFKIEQDSIRKVLNENNFTISKDATKKNIIYSSPEGYKAIFNTFDDRKTQDLLLIVPDKHEIINKVISANKADKRAKRQNAQKKPPLPTFHKDFLGDELIIGDWVAYSSLIDTDLRVGRITKLNEKSVTLMDRNRGKIAGGKRPNQIIKISKERAVLLMFES